MRISALLALFCGLMVLVAGCSGGSETPADTTSSTQSDTSGATTPADTAAKPDFAALKGNLTNFCLPCHSSQSKQGGVDVTAFADEASIDKATFAKMAAEVEGKKMPPTTAGKQPTDEERAAIVAGLKAF